MPRRPYVVRELPSRFEDEFLVKNWPRNTAGEIGKMLGWKPARVRNRARKLGLAVSWAMSVARQRKLDADRASRRAALGPLAGPAVATSEGWSDGWRIEPPSMARLRAGR